MERMQYWFNVRTHEVETTDGKSQSKDLLGPYESYAEAAQALERARERTETWDAEDRQWAEGTEE